MLARTPLPAVVRETDVSRINLVVNHEAVHPHVTIGGDNSSSLYWGGWSFMPRNYGG